VSNDTDCKESMILIVCITVSAHLPAHLHHRQHQHYQQQQQRLLDDDVALLQVSDQPHVQASLIQTVTDSVISAKEVM